MKKLLVLILALVMCLTALTSCDQIKGFIDGIINPEKPGVETPVETQADGAITLLKSSYKDWYKTAADYTLDAFTHQGDVKIEWSVNVGEEYIQITHDYDKGVVYVKVNTESPVDVEYVLTAKATDAEGNVRTISFNLLLPKDKLTTYDELVAASKDDTLKVQGIVTGIIKKSEGWSANSLYLQDEENKGGYYVYNLADEEIAGVEVGMTVKATGTKDTYNGIFEVMNGKIQIVDTTIKAVTPVDFTEVFTNAADIAANDLVYRQSMLVTLKGVEISTQNEAQGYLNFKLGGKEAYVRISSSNNCITKTEAAALKTLHASNFGNTADVTGLIQLYNGNFYLIPATGIPAISNIKEVEKTPAEKVDAEKTNLKIETSYSTDGDYTLPVVGANFSDVTISWASNNENVVVGANGVITVKIPDTKTEVTLTATITCGEVTATKEIKITLNKTITAIADANELGAAQEHNTYTADKYLVAGVVTEVVNSTYGNLYISDGVNKFYVYGLYDVEGKRYDKMENAPVVGDYIVVLTALGQYNGAPQGKNATLVTHESTTATVVEANTTGAAQEHNTYTADKYLVTGVVDEIANSTYGNIYIKDEEGNRFYIYGLYDVCGIRFDKMTAKPAVGDTITVLTALGQYNGTAQGKNATLVSLTVATTAPEHTHTACTECGKCTAEDCTGEATDKCEGHEVAPTHTHTPCATCNLCTAADCTGEASEKCAGHQTTPPAGDTTTYNQVTDLTTLKTGDKVVIGAPAYNKLLSMVKVATYYNKGVDYSATDFSNVTDDEIFVVTVNADGTYEFVSVSGEVLALSAGFSSLDVTSAHKTWKLIAVEGKAGLFYIENAGRTGYRIEWYASKNNWSTYNNNFNDLFELAIYTVPASSGTVTPPTHTHTVCTECGKCTAEDCTGEATDKCEGHTSTPVDVTTVTYNFATASTEKGTKLTNETALALFTASGSADVLTSVTVTNIYNGNADGGAYPQTSGFVKAGKSNGDGTLVLNFGDLKVVKVEIKCHDWYKASAQYPTNSNKVSVNGSAEVLAPYNEAGTPDVLTFTVDNASSVTILTNDRVFIFEIVVTFAE